MHTTMQKKILAIELDSLKKCEGRSVANDGGLSQQRVLC